MAQWLRKICTWWTAASLASVLASCGDNVKVTNVQPTVNQPPRILVQGPNYPSTTIDIRTSGYPRLFVVVADPNGLEDISAVLLSVDTAIVLSATVRPDSLTFAGGLLCSYVSRTDTVDISSLYPQIYLRPMVNQPMVSKAGVFSLSAFEVPDFDQPSALPRIDLASSSFGIPLARCTELAVAVLRFGVYPPAVPAALEVSITRMEVEYRGIHVTAYDTAGASDSTSFPPLRLLYAALLEPNVVAPASE